METYSALLAICAENSPVPGEFTAQRPVTRSFDVFFDLRLNKRLSKQSWGWWFETLSHLLWRHRNEIWSYWFRQSSGTEQEPSGCLSKRLHYCRLWNIIQWNFDKNPFFFTDKNEFQIVVRKTLVIWIGPHYVNHTLCCKEQWWYSMFRHYISYYAMTIYLVSYG